MDQMLTYFPNKETCILIGVIITTFFSGFALKKTKKLTENGYYIKEITGLRAKYIESLRKQVAEFASKALELSRLTHGSDKNEDLLRDFELSFGLVKLYLNEENQIDLNLAKFLDKIRESAINYDANETISLEINQLFTYTQKVLLFEWQNLKYESKGKPFTDDEIKIKRDTFIEKYDELINYK